MISNIFLHFFIWNRVFRKMSCTFPTEMRNSTLFYLHILFMFISFACFYFEPIVSSIENDPVQILQKNAQLDLFLHPYIVILMLILIGLNHVLHLFIWSESFENELHFCMRKVQHYHFLVSNNVLFIFDIFFHFKKIDLI